MGSGFLPRIVFTGDQTLMFIPSILDASASTVSAPTALPTSAPHIPREQVRHMLFGTPTAVKSTIRRLHKLGYAEPNDWSRAMSTRRANEVMAILTKRVSGEQA